MTETRPKVTTANLPRGPLTTAEREARRRFVVEQITNHRLTDSQRIRAIEQRFGVKRLQARRYLAAARADLGRAVEDYKDNFERDQVLWLLDVRGDVTCPIRNRLEANRQLQYVFGTVKSQVDVNVSGGVVNVELQARLNQNPKAIEALLALEDAIDAAGTLQPPEDHGDSDAGEVVRPLPPHQGD